MARLNAANNARTTLAENITSGATSFNVTSGAIFPLPPFKITLGNEIMEVGSHSDIAPDVFASVLRGQEGTTATSHSAGDIVENRPTAGAYNELATQAEVDEHKADTANPHNVTKEQVGLGDVQNLSAEGVRTASSYKLRAEVKSSAPSSPINGDIWYDSANHKFLGRANGAWV